MRRPLACLGVALTVAATAEAAPFRYTISAECTASCDAIGLSIGESVSGRFTLGGFAPGADFATADLLDFSVRLGSTTITGASATGASIDGTWGARPRDVTFVALIAGTTLFPATGPGFSLSTQGGFASLAASCDLADCSAASFPPTAAVTGEATVAPVPAPPALLLGATGVAALLTLARRRGARPAQA